MANFVIQKKGIEHYFAVLLTVNGDTILRGPNCISLLECYQSIDSIRAHARDFSKYELTDSHDGKYFFGLKGSDGIDVARSVVFKTPADVYFGIEYARRTIPSASLENFQS